MYELVLIENKVYEGKKAGKVILIFSKTSLIIILNEYCRKLAAMVPMPNVWASIWSVSQMLTFSDNRQLILVFQEHLAAFELIDKAHGNNGVWDWEKVMLVIIEHFFKMLI